MDFTGKGGGPCPSVGGLTPSIMKTRLWLSCLLKWDSRGYGVVREGGEWEKESKGNSRLWIISASMDLGVGVWRTDHSVLQKTDNKWINKCIMWCLRQWGKLGKEIQHREIVISDRRSAKSVLKTGLGAETLMNWRSEPCKYLRRSIV